MSITPNHHKSNISYSSKVVRKKRIKCVLSKKTFKDPKQTNRYNDQREERECSGCK